MAFTNPQKVSSKGVTLLALVAFSFLFGTKGLSQNIYSRVTGNWNTGTTWSTDNVLKHTGASCGCTPGAANTVIIGGGHTITYQSGSTTVIISALTVNDAGGGTLTFGSGGSATTLTISGDVTVNASGTIQSGSTGVTAHIIQIGGNLINDGTFNQAVSLSTATGQSVTFNGTAVKTLSGAGTYSFNNVTMGTSGSSNVNVNSSITVNGILNFANDGLLVVNSSSNITLGSSATITNPSSTKYIQLDGASGSNSQLIKTTSNATGPWQITYPIGTSSGGYTPLVIPTVAGTSPTNGATLAIKAIYNANIQGQLRRTFRMVISGNAAATTFSNPAFSYNAGVDVSTGDALGNYTNIWTLAAASGSWSTVVGTVPGVGAFTVTTPSHNLVTGTYYYTIGTSTAYPNTWYSYKSGSWSNWKNWTSDPSGTTRLNGLNLPPQPGDEIIILTGITITNDVNGQVVSNTTIQSGATLDMVATTGNTLGTISGTGVLRMQGVNLPTGTYTSFIAAGTGGTIEYYDTSGTLPTSQLTYNNLLLTNSSGSPVTFTSANGTVGTPLTINGNLTITGGSSTVTWQINDATNTQRFMTINGNLVVSANGQIRAGTGNAAGGTPHALTIYGNITNNGSIKFFDNTDATYSDANYTSRAVFNSALFGNTVAVTFKGLTNNTITSNSLTDFYQLIMDKGTGQQATLTVNSSSTSNFRIFGTNNILMGGTAPNHFSNSGLSLRNGTLILTGSISIPSLCEVQVAGATSDGQSNGFPIPQNAALWLNGAGVTVQVAPNSGPDDFRQIYLYGLLRISAGTFNLGYSRGLLGTLAGQFLIEGSTATSILNTMQLRTTQNSAGNIFTYTQTGGTVNVGTSGLVGITETNAPRFSIPFSACTFNMSGGILNVASPTPSGVAVNGGILIAASTSNIQVTGGTVNAFVPASTVSFNINSTAPFYNLTISKEGAGSATATLAAQNANINGATLVYGALPLTVLNTLTLATAATSANSPTFACNNNNVTVGGNFDIQTGTTLTPGTNTITFNGSTAQSWTHNGTITSLNNVIVNKPAGIGLTMNGGNAFPSMVGLTLTSGTLNDNGKTLTVTSALSNNAVHTSTGSGSIVYSNAGASSTIGGSGLFGNLTIQNTASSNVTISTGGAQIITGNFRLINAFTCLNIGSYNLKVNGSIYSDAGTSEVFTSQNRIVTSGLSNDDGLTRQAISGAPLLFPLGTTSVAYTPVTITVVATTMGTISVNPVVGAHPNVTATAQSVRYYWRVLSAGFDPLNMTSVTHSAYTYSNAVKDAFLVTSYRPARYNSSTFTWNYGPTFGAGGATTIPTFNTGTGWSGGLTKDLLDGEYTAGNAVAFGAVSVYTSIASGLWSATSTWTNTSGTTSIPCGTCPVIIGDGASNNHTVTIDANSQSCGSLQISSLSTLDCGTFTGLNFGSNSQAIVSGEGTIRIASVNFPAGDFSDFLGSGGGTVEWYGNTYTIPSVGPAPQSLNLSAYKNLTINPNAGQVLTLPTTSLTIYNNFIKSGSGQAITNGTNRTITVNNNLNVSGGSFTISNAAITTFVVKNTRVDNGANFSVQNAAGARTHTYSASGDFTNNGTVLFKSAVGTEFVNLTFTGSSNTKITGTDETATTTLNLLTVNKGTSSAASLTLDIVGTLNLLSDNWLTLSTGTMNFNRASATAITLMSSTTTAFSIPSTAKLMVQAGTVNATTVANNSSDISLSGAIEVGGGTLNIGSSGNNNNNDIEYSTVGVPSITVTGGVMYVNGSIRRPTTTLAGALGYSQSGGTVTVGGRSSSNTRGVFEIESNAGSQFAVTGGTLAINRTTSGTQYADLYINPETVVASTGTINLGIAGTTQTISVNITPALGNLVVLDNTTVSMQSSPLTISSALTINPSAILLPNTLGVTIGGNLTVNGTYDGVVGGTNTTTFNGTGSQAASLSASSTFLNITINKPSGTITLSGTSPTITNLNILSGTLDVGALNLAVTGDIVNNSIQTSSNVTPGTITISGGSATHTITSSGGQFQNLTLGGSATSKKITVSGNLTIDGTLDFSALGTSRYLFIGSNKLIFTTNGSVANLGVSGTRFIRTNGVSSDLGVEKNWSVATSSFTYAVGTRTNYTPVIFTGFVATGALTIVPVDDQHPSASATGEQILSYYWIVRGGSTLAYTANVGTHVYQFPSAFIGGAGGSLIAAHLDAINLVGWTPSPGNGGSINTPTKTLMTFTNSAIILPQVTNLPSANGEFHYTLGTTNTLPNPVAFVYSRKDGNANLLDLTAGGDWDLATNWTTASSGIGGTVQSVFPYGRPISIVAGTRVNMDVDGLKAVSTQINGLLVIDTTGVAGPSTSGHSLGSISGTGTLRTSIGTLPAGNYTNFVSSTGGTIEYVASSTNIDLIRSAYNNLSMINNPSNPGTGTVNIKNSTDLTLNGNLTMGTGTVLDNSSFNRNISIRKNWIDNGSFIAGTGTVTFNGSSNQSITESAALYNVTMATTAGVNLTLNRTTTVSNQLTLTTGTIVSSSGATLIIGPTATISGGSSSSFVQGPMQRSITAAGSFTFPGGGSGRYRPSTISATGGSATWTVEYFSTNYNPLTFSAPLGKVSNFEYWIVTPSAAFSADVELTYGTGSYRVNPTNIGTLANLRVAHWNGSSWGLPSFISGGGTLTQSPGSTSVSGTLKVTGISSFSPITFGSTDSDSPLPVRWLSFTASRVDHSVSLNWQTAQELNSDHFEIERSNDGHSFNSIGSRKAVGNSSVVQSYQFTDNETSDNITYYYRLRQIDLDGKFDFSSIVAVAGKSDGKWKAWPNPINDQQQFHLSLIDKSQDNSMPVDIKLTSCNGVIIFTDSGSLDEITIKLETLLHNLGNGVYVIQLSDGLFQQHFRMVRY